MTKQINLTPTWQEILPTWLMLYRQAIEGNCANPDLIKANATAELNKMAKAADSWNLIAPLLADAEHFTKEELLSKASSLFEQTKD